MGPYVARELLAAGHSVCVFHRGSAGGTIAEGAQELLGNRRSILDHAEALRAWKPDVVLDMVCMTIADAQGLVNVYAGHAQRLVVASSIDVYRAYGLLTGTEEGEPQPTPLTEDSELRTRLYPFRADVPRPADDPRAFLDDYDKILVEQTVMASPGLPATVLRLPMVYGPGDGQRRLTPYLKRMLDHRPAIILEEVSAAWQTSRGYVENVAHAIALCCTDARAAGRIYNVAQQDNSTEQQWIARIAATAGWPGRIIVVPAWQLPEELKQGALPAQHLDADSSRIRRELGYSEPVSPEDALALTVVWEGRTMPAEFPDGSFNYEAEDAWLKIREDTPPPLSS